MRRDNLSASESPRAPANNTYRSKGAEGGE